MFGSTVAHVDELRSFDTVLGTPLPLSRRIGFVQARGGAGASATAAYVANLLARRRPGYVLGVDASVGSAGMLWHAGLPASSEQRETTRRRTARRAADAVDGLPRLASGLWTMDLRDETRQPTSVASWFDNCSPITRFYDLVVTDWGVRDWRLDLGDVASASHALCLVARADRHSLEQVGGLVDALRSLPDAPTVVIAAVDVGSTGVRSPERIVSALDIDVVAIPYDGERASARPIGSRALATDTRIAYTRLAATLTAAAAGQRPSRPAIAKTPESVDGPASSAGTAP